MISNMSSSRLRAELAQIAAGLVGGARYGVKIRLPHALVMTLLFRRDLSAPQKLRSVVSLVVEHASNLAAFAAIYKSALALLKWISILSHQSLERPISGESALSSWRAMGNGLVSVMVDGPLSHRSDRMNLSTPGYAKNAYHALVAGAVGGYVIWGRYSSVNYQIVLYLASRILVSLWKRTNGNRASHPRVYALMAASVWGVVMALFEECPEVLHPSLKSSMDEIYRFQLIGPNDATQQAKE